MKSWIVETISGKRNDLDPESDADKQMKIQEILATGELKGGWFRLFDAKD